MHQFLYISKARVHIANEELVELCAQARRHNAEQGLTGLLISVGGKFIQLLEGDADAVHSLVAKIRRDERHHEFLQLLDRPSDARLFPDWSMGLARSSSVRADDTAAFSSFVDDVRSGKHSASPSDPTPLKLLRRFATHVD